MIDELTIGEAKQLARMFGGDKGESKGIPFAIGEKVIVRTYSAGVWFGELKLKAKNEVVLGNARRMWRWFAVDGVCLSACARNGIDRSKSKICVAVETVWLEAIEILPCTQKAIDSIEGADNVIPE